MSFSAAPTESFDVIVVGGGHAGCEAAITAARLGLNTALFSLNLDRIAWQPCNPAVGGPAKSQLVHEVDALGGVIGRLADATAIQKRILNASRGPAVWALRAQTDKRLYSRQMLQLLQHTPNLALREAMVTGLETTGEGDQQRISGIRTYFGSVYGADAVILTAGTFLGGRIWVGHQSMAAGRAGRAGRRRAHRSAAAARLPDRPAQNRHPPHGWTGAASPSISWKSSPAMQPIASSPLTRPPG